LTDSLARKSNSSSVLFRRRFLSLVGLDRQVNLLQVEDNRAGDQEDDQQNQHHVHEGRGVDF